MDDKIKRNSTSSSISPLDAYEIIINLLEVMSDDEQLIITRFFDKLADSSGYQYRCKESISPVHLKSKDLFHKRKIVYSGSREIILLNSCKLVPIRTEKDLKWNFVLNGDVLITDLSPEIAFKIVKDINTAFQIINK